VYTYKLVEIKQKSFFKGHMKLEDLEGKINEFATQGWILDRIVSGETANSLGFGMDVFILVFKMEQ